jgi:hypothetical protein
MRRGIVLLVVAALFAGATALAQDGGVGVEHDGAVLQLEQVRSCRSDDPVTLRVLPPSTQLGWVSVRLDGRQIVRLTGVGNAASVTLRLPRSGGRIGVSAETLDGQRLATGRRYAACTPPPPAPSPPQPRRGEPPTIVGGGEA